MLRRAEQEIQRAWRYFQKNGISSFFRRALQELSATRFTGDLGNRRQKPLRAAVDNNPAAIDFCVDLPSDALFVTSQMVPVGGWALAPAGIEAIDVYLDGEFFSQMKTGGIRDDVASAFPDMGGAASSGFADTLNVSDLLVGTHSMCIAIHDRAGNTVTVDRTIQRIENSQLYQRHFIASLWSPEKIRTALQSFARKKEKTPHIELWLRCSPGLEGLSETLKSIADQNYLDWSCHLVAPKSQWETIRSWIAPLPGKGEQFHFHKVLTPAPPGDGRPEYLGIIAEGELLSPDALLRWALELANALPGMSYSDHDMIKPGGLHCEPNFKPDWSPDYALSKNYVGGLFLVNKAAPLAEHLAALSESLASPAWRYDLWLRLSGLDDSCDDIQHVSNVLWSEPYREAPSPAVIDDELAAVQGALRRSGTNAHVESLGKSGLRRIAWPIPLSRPKVSIIIPTTGRPELVRRCVESLREKTRYEHYELVFLDNGHGKHQEGIDFLRFQGIKVVEHKEPFNWARLNNIGAAASDGDLLLFLNDDIEVMDGEWLGELVAQVSRPNVGAAGAMLLYPDGRIQHGGIWLVDHGGGARHHLHFLKPDEEIYQDLQHVVREVSGNTGACLMMRREVFDELEGFDEDLAVVGNDLDMCLRVSRAGYRNLWTPFSRLIHYESISRKNTSIMADEGKMWKRWEKAFMAGDPFYNPNLTQLRTDYSLKEKAPPGKVDRSKEGGGKGVNLIGYIRAEMGIGEATRGCACAMEAAQINFGIINYEYGNPSRMNDGSWDSHVVDELGYDINILHINADLTPDAVKRLPKDYFSGRYNIGFWTWELPEFPDEWTSAFDYLDEVWVPSSFVYDAVVRKSTIPVVRVPYSIRKLGVPYLDREFFQLPGHGFLFLMMYDIHSIEERKNPKGAIRAFSEAFSSTDQDVGLVIKVNNASAEELAMLREELAGHKSVYIIDTVMDRYEVDSLISCCDCFVSLHRSEGFGLVVAEAMALGRPVIATNWSGNTDFMTTDNAACVDFELRQLGENYGPYKAHQHWAEPDIEHAAWWMQKLAADPAAAQKMGARAKQAVERQLAPKQVGELIHSRLQEIRKGLKPAR